MPPALIETVDHEQIAVGVDESEAVFAVKERFGRRLRFLTWGFAALAIFGLVLMRYWPETTPYVLYGLYSIPSNSLLPIMNEPGLLLFAPFGHPLLLATAGACGTMIAATTDYTLLSRLLDSPRLAGVREHRFLQWVLKAFRRAPAATIVLFAAAPLPFSLVRLLSPASHYPLRRYVLATTTGRFVRYALVAYLGVALGIPVNVTLGIFFAALLYPAFLLGRLMVRRARRHLGTQQTR